MGLGCHSCAGQHLQLKHSRGVISQCDSSQDLRLKKHSQEKPLTGNAASMPGGFCWCNYANIGTVGKCLSPQRSFSEHSPVSCMCLLSRTVRKVQLTALASELTALGRENPFLKDMKKAAAGEQGAESHEGGCFRTGGLREPWTDPARDPFASAAAMPQCSRGKGRQKPPSATEACSLLDSSCLDFA